MDELLWVIPCLIAMFLSGLLFGAILTRPNGMRVQIRGREGDGRQFVKVTFDRWGQVKYATPWLPMSEHFQWEDPRP